MTSGLAVTTCTCPRAAVPALEAEVPPAHRPDFDQGNLAALALYDPLRDSSERFARRVSTSPPAAEPSAHSCPSGLSAVSSFRPCIAVSALRAPLTGISSPPTVLTPRGPQDSKYVREVTSGIERAAAQDPMGAAREVFCLPRLTRSAARRAEGFRNRPSIL